MVSRRSFLAGTIAAWMQLAAPAQAPRKTTRLAWFSDGALTAQRPYVQAFKEGMKELGLVEGRDYTVDYYWRGMSSTVPSRGWRRRSSPRVPTSSSPPAP